MKTQHDPGRLAAGLRYFLPDPAAESSRDGWLGTPDLPGYRAGQIVVKLADLPGVDAEHLYFDLLLLDADGRIEDSHSGPCPALHRRQPAETRARFVRVVAELLRHAADPLRGLAGLGGALTHLREHGVDGGQLAVAAQQLDVACTEGALVASLAHILALSLGEDEAQAALCEVLAGLARGGSRSDQAWPGNDDELPLQVACVVRLVGKARARRYLREATDFELLPAAELLGV